MPPRRINEIVLGKRGITADTALRLARYFGTSVDVWMNLQSRYVVQACKRHFGRPVHLRRHPMPNEYFRIRDALVKQGKPLREAKREAARIYNARRRCVGHEQPGA